MQKEKMSVIQIVQDEIMSELVTARLGAEGGEAIPVIRRSIDVDVMNGISFRPYQAVNKWMLSFDQETFYFTWKNIQDIGASVKPGKEKEYRRVFLFVPDRTEVDKKTGKEVHKHAFWKYFRVYRWQDIDGIPYPELPEDKQNKRSESFEEFVSRLAGKLNIAIVETGNGASHSDDTIHIAPLSRFESAELYYATLFREIVRLVIERQEIKLSEYREHLVAEIGSATLCQRFDVNIIPETIGDIDACIRELTNDAKLFVSACSNAKKVLDYLDA